MQPLELRLDDWKMSEKKFIEATAIVFLKAPRIGTVKTRLAASIGPEMALAAYRSMATHQLGALPPDWTTEVYYTPRAAASEMHAWLGKDICYRLQSEGDLGDRLSAAVKSHFDKSSNYLFLLGADCPWLGTKELEQAAEQLVAADIVLGPAHDGGYYLLGIKENHRALFEEIAWSTGDVLEQTLERARSSHLSVHQLQPLNDVDTVEEWIMALRSFPHLGSVRGGR